MRQVGNLVTCGIASAARKAPNPVTFRWCSQHYDEVRQFFSRRGAYRRYKELLVRRDALEVRFLEQIRGGGFAGVVRGEQDRPQRDLA